MVDERAAGHSGAMTTTPPAAPPTDGPHDGAREPGPRVSGADIRDVTRLRRTVGTERRIAGVAGGLARHLDIDPVLVRVAFVVLALFGGGGLVLYLALWLVLPDESGGAPTLQLDPRSLTVAIVGVGVLAVLILLGQSWWGFTGFPWPLAVIGLVVLFFVLNRRQPGQPAPYGAQPPWPVPPPPPSTDPAMPTQVAASPAQEYGAPVYSTAPYSSPAYSSPAYSSPAYPTATYAAPTYATPIPPASYVPPPQTWTPPNPRRRGPILFWFTLALITLSLGILGMVDVSGRDIPASAYAALATGISGLMLLVGSVYGRAGGIILLGLMSALVMAGTSVEERITNTPTTEHPTTAVQVDSRYWKGAGELVVDLTEVADPAALNGRTIRLEGGAGRLEVIVPSDWTVYATGTIGGPGKVTVFGQSTDGIDLRRSENHVPADSATRITVDAELGVGEIDIHTEEQS